jgi:hypothetical protein
MTRYARIHPERPARRVAVALALSLLVNAAIVALLGAWERAAAEAAQRADAERPRVVALERLDPARWEENRSLAKTFVPSAAFAPMPESARPEHARFLSDRDRRAEHETVAAPAPGMPGMPAANTPDPRRAQAAAPTELPKAGGSAPPSPNPGPDGAGPRAPDLTPDLAARPPVKLPLAMNFKVAGEGGVPEIDGVGIGGFTVLNAEAWRYANFFDRIGETLYGVWRVEFLPRPPIPSIAAHPRGGSARVAFSVTLDGSGRALDVTVKRGSGMTDVDALLAELLKRSAPFPNVPRGLLDEHGQYTDIWVLGLVWGWRG